MMRGIVSAFATILCAVLLVVTPVPAGATESILLWDEGVGWGAPPDSMHFIAGFRGMMAAVDFETPASTDFLVAVMVFVAETPESGGPSRRSAATESLKIHVWSPENPDYPSPGEDAVVPVVVQGGYPQHEWVRFDLPTPVDLDDANLFPERLFSVGVEWLVRKNPRIGFDAVGAVDLHSWKFPWYPPWEVCDEYDLMMRAVVSDSVDTVIRPVSWGAIKSEFR